MERIGAAKGEHKNRATSSKRCIQKINLDIDTPIKKKVEKNYVRREEHGNQRIDVSWISSVDSNRGEIEKGLGCTWQIE